MYGQVLAKLDEDKMALGRLPRIKRWKVMLKSFV